MCLVVGVRLDGSDSVLMSRIDSDDHVPRMSPTFPQSLGSTMSTLSFPGFVVRQIELGRAGRFGCFFFACESSVEMDLEEVVQVEKGALEAGSDVEVSVSDSRG